MKKNNLINHLRAGFTCFWMVTSEPTRVKQIYYNKLTNYLSENPTSKRNFQIAEWSCVKSPNYDEPLIRLSASCEQDTVMFLYNYHFYAKQPKAIQLIQDSIPEWASQGKAIIIVSALQQIPPELEKDFTLMHLPLPGDEEIVDIMEQAVPNENSMPKGEKLEELVKASKSLSARELDNVCSLCLVEKGGLDVITINDYRAQAIKKSGFAEVMKHDVSFKDVIGHERPIAQVVETINNPMAKGVIWIGPPGTGKTTLGKAIATESGKLGLQVHTGKFLSKYQGESDRLLDEFFRMLYSLGEVYLFLDEFDKQFAGAGGSGEMDSGTGKRQAGRWQEFLQDRPPGIYVNATCNSFVGVPSAMFRVGRWDSAPWYVGLPSPKVRNKMLDHFIKKFELLGPQITQAPETDHWTGAEIEALCHNAKMRNMTLMEAEEFIIPMYKTSKEEVKALEEWAKGRCIPSEEVPKIKVSPPRKRALDL